MQKAIEDVLRPPPEAIWENAAQRVRVELATDLHEPDALEIQVACALFDAGAERRVLARGWSTIVHFERLYCHGCRESWSGHGTKLSSHPPVGGDYYTGSAGVYFYSAPGCSSPGYIKH
jgi:hypothetical protein